MAETKQKALAKPAAVLVRVSSKQQVEKVSLDEQTATAEALCRQHHLTVGHVFREEGISASKDTLDNRPTMRDILDRIEAGEFGALVAFAPNRISRNDLAAQVIILRLKLAGAVLITPEFTMDPQDPTDRLTAYMQFWAAGRDSDARTKAIKMGKRGLRSRGRFPESRVPFGYRWQKGERGRSGEGKPVEDPREAKGIKLIYTLCGTGMRPAEVVEELTRRGVLSRSQEQWRLYKENPDQYPEPKRPAAPWDPCVIMRLVRRREYLGEWRTDDNTLWQDAPRPMVSKAVWARAQAAVSRKTGPRRKHVRRFLLQGHLTCGRCGKRLTISQPIGADARWRYYRCSKGCRPYLAAAALEEAVWSEVSRYINDPALLAKGAEKFRQHGLEAWQEERGTLELAVIGCEQAIEKAEDGFLHGLWGEGRVSAIQQINRDKKANLEAQIAALTERIEKGESERARLLALEGMAKRLKDPDGMSYEAKRRTLESFGIEIVLPAEESEKLVIRWYGAPLAGVLLNQLVESDNAQSSWAILEAPVGFSLSGRSGPALTAMAEGR